MSEKMRALSTEQLGELVSIHLSELTLGAPLSIHQSNWRGETGQLARMGLVTWDSSGRTCPPRFRGVGVTEKGRDLLNSIPQDEKMGAYDACMAQADWGCD